MGRTGGHVAIGSAESAAIDLLPSLLVAFQAEYPGTRFALGVGAPRELLEDLLDDKVDLILTHEEPTHHDVAIRATARMPFCAMMQASHPLAQKNKLFIKECLNYPIVMAQEHLAARALVDTALIASSHRTQPVLVTNMFEVMKKYARLTDAISFQFHLAPLFEPEMDGLVAVPLADPLLAEARLMLAVRRGRVLPTVAGIVCERIENLLREAVRQ